jgi:ribonuclease HI
METIYLYVDGGCLANGKEGAQMYWSLGIKRNSGEVKEFTFDGKRLPNPFKFDRSFFDDKTLLDGHNTNNIAELLAVHAALFYIKGLVRRYELAQSKLHEHVRFEIVSDSEYAIGVVTGAYVPKKNKRIVEENVGLFNGLNDVDTEYPFIAFSHAPREKIVEILGH